VKDIQLVRLDPAIEESLINDSAYINAMAEEKCLVTAIPLNKRTGFS
jgi:hypothetical protein